MRVKSTGSWQADKYVGKMSAVCVMLKQKGVESVQFGEAVAEQNDEGDGLGRLHRRGGRKRLFFDGLMRGREN